MSKGMTNQQFEMVLKMIITIIKDSQNKEEAIQKIEALLPDQE